MREHFLNYSVITGLPTPVLQEARFNSYGSSRDPIYPGVDTLAHLIKAKDVGANKEKS